MLVSNKSRAPAMRFMKMPMNRHKKAFSLLLPLLAGIILLQAQSSFAQIRTLPKFSLRLIDGSTVDSGGLEGKVTVIDFWGTWCKPCLVEIPEYNRLYHDFKDKDVRLLALAADSGSMDEVREAAKRLKIEYPVAVPTWDELDLFGSIEAFPTTLVFDTKGKLAKSFVGTSADKQAALRRTVEQLLAAR